MSDDKKNISLPTDEEGNDETILTPKSAVYVGKLLIAYAKAIEPNIDTHYDVIVKRGEKNNV